MHAGDIFQQWDAVVSWNRWAIDWAANGLPRRTAEYPQLLPTNLSLTYVFIQDSTIWFFAKGLMPLFCLFLLLAMLDLGQATKQTGYYCAVPIAYGLLVAVLRFRFISSGYGDVPVAFMGFAGVYALLLATLPASHCRTAGEPLAVSRASPTGECFPKDAPARSSIDAAMRMKYVLLGAVLCAGAALTKQAGLYIAAVYPILAWSLAGLHLSRSPIQGLPLPSGEGWGEGRLTRAPNSGGRPFSGFPSPRPSPKGRGGLLAYASRQMAKVPWGQCREMALVLLLLVVLIAPWYVYKLLAIHGGADNMVTAYLLHDIHQGRNLWQRLLHAGGLLRAAIPLPVIAALLAAMALALRDPVQRRLMLLVAAPLALLWALGFSYDLRNIALAIPFAAAAAGFGAVGLEGIRDWGLGIRRRVQGPPLPFGRGPG